MNRAYYQGRRAEWELTAMLEADGWTVLSRGAGSHKVDIIAVKDGLITLFTVKCSYMPPTIPDLRRAACEITPYFEAVKGSAYVALAYKILHYGWVFGLMFDGKWCLWAERPYARRRIPQSVLTVLPQASLAVDPPPTLRRGDNG